MVIPRSSIYLALPFGFIALSPLRLCRLDSQTMVYHLSHRSRPAQHSLAFLPYVSEDPPLIIYALVLTSNKALRVPCLLVTKCCHVQLIHLTAIHHPFIIRIHVCINLKSSFVPLGDLLLAPRSVICDCLSHANIMKDRTYPSSLFPPGGPWPWLRSS